MLWPEVTEGFGIKQLKRTPYITGFRAGYKLFAIINLHLHPGDDDDDVAYREKEVTLLLDALQKKRDKNHLWTEKLILAGDFNFYTGADKDDPTVQTVVDAGYREVLSLVGVDTNASETQTYDRLFIGAGDFFEVATDDHGGEIGGVFNPFDHVFAFGDEAVYLDEMKAVYGGIGDLDLPAVRDKYFKNYWRKNQLSDHYPIWFDLVTDNADGLLERISAELG
ncbi:MAG TPA: hypothetical protein QGF58_30715 [Myxococcota bacterium]|nr:hypothetical protein [Myxococcota bacterium]